MSQVVAITELRALLATPSANAPSAPNDARQTAFFQLQSLRESGDPSFLFLRTLIELTSNVGGGDSGKGTAGADCAGGVLTGPNEELAFHCIGGIRHVLLHKWSTYNAEFRSTVRDWLMVLGLSMIPRTVSNAALGCCASMWKRGWVSTADDGNCDGVGNGNNGSSDSDATKVENAKAQSMLVGMMMGHCQHRPNRIGSHLEFYQFLESLISRPFTSSGTAEARDHINVYAASQASVLLINLLGEISGTSKGGAYNLPLEFHREVHSAFEGVNNGLDATLRVAMVGLGGVVKTLTDNQNGVDKLVVELCANAVALTVDAMSWEFGAGTKRASFVLGEASGGGLASIIRPPERWREHIVRPDFLGAVFQVYTAVRKKPYAMQSELSHNIRQLLLILSSVSGIIYESKEQRQAYAGFLVDGCLNVLALLHQEATGDLSAYDEEHAESETVDLCGMVGRLVATFRVEWLSSLPSFGNLLGAVAAVGNDLLQKSLIECEQANGDFNDMDGIEWRSEALSHLLDATVLLADDPWLLGGGGDAVRAAESALGASLSPLYGSYINVRVKMAKVEEHYIACNSEDLDEVREDIAEVATEDEMTSASSLGRLNVAAAVTSLSTLLNQCLPKIQTLFEAPANTVTTAEGEINPDAAALLEEVRLLVVCITHLLTDENAGEAPVIPDAIIRACRPANNVGGTVIIVGALITSLMQLSEYLASMLTVDPSDPRISPFLVKTLLCFFNRWAPAYILPSTDQYECSDQVEGGILSAWSSQDNATSAINFCLTLCLHYHCLWPQESQVQEASASLLLELAKRGKLVRAIVTKSPSFEKLAATHEFSTSLRHGCSQAEIKGALTNAHAAGRPLDGAMLAGYCRLPYPDRAKVLTGLIVASCESSDQKANAIFNHCLLSVQNSFSTLVQALSNKQVQAQDVNAKELACLCVELYGGIARGSDVSGLDRIPQFITPSLQPLSELMAHYADDLTICEALLRLFCDYAERFISVCNRDQCLALFNASCLLLKGYSSAHCNSRRTIKVSASSLEENLEEEKNYSDILSAISLLTHLSTKDFIDVCSTTNASTIDTNQVTNMIFFGLQQILPLMTQGLLQFPRLCTNYFSLVGFMMDTYPEKVCALPYDLFNALLDSMLFGMSHSDTFVSKSSLRGLSGLAREHLKSRALSSHLAQNADIVDNCTTRLLKEVVFQSIIWERLEPAGAALLPLAAVDMTRFGGVVNAISSQFGSAQKKQRFERSFQSLMLPEVVAKVSSGGYEGRINRLKFKACFEEFVKEIHSFLVMA